MGLLTNIFVADPQHPPAADEEPEVPDDDRIQLKSITSLHLATLWAIVDAVPWSADRMNGFDSLTESEEGPWLERCPTGLAESLRAAVGSDLSRIAREWA